MGRRKPFPQGNARINMAEPIVTQLAGGAMSTPAPAGSEAPSTPTPLSLLERRVLGVMVEKAKTTPDAYPMSINSLVAGSNQKSNRDPILNLNDEVVEQTLDR